MYQENDKLLKKLKKLDGMLLPHLAKSSEDKAAIYKAAELEAMKGITEDMKTTMAGFKSKLTAMQSLVMKINNSSGT